MTTVLQRRTDLNQMQKMRNRVQILHWISTGGTLNQWYPHPVATALFWSISC